MQSAIAIAVLLGISSMVSANDVITSGKQNILLSDGKLFPLTEPTDKFTITTYKYNNQQKVVQRNEGRQRFIVELHDMPVSTYISSLKRQEASALSPIPSNNRQQQYYVNESLRYAAQIKVQQQRVWSTLTNLDRQAILQKSHYKLLNAIVIDLDPLYLKLVEKIPGVKRVSAEKRVYASLAYSVPLVRAPQMWSLSDANQLSVTGHGVDVAVLDTGIDYTHPALGGCLGSQCKVVAGYDFHNQDADPMDGHGHGTHVAGIIAAQAVDYSGVAPDVKLHAYKVLSDDGWGNDTNIISALEYAVDPDNNPATDDAVDIINMSLGGSGDAEDPLSMATNAAVDAGIIVVVAAGNNSGFGDIGRSSPASAAKAITVASTTKTDELSYFSSKGESLAGAPLKPEIAAPGSDIVAPYLHHSTKSLDGTSMASPHVAGAAALLKQLYPTARVADIRGMLMAGTVDLGLLPFEQGAGRLDIEAASQATIYSQHGIVAFGQIDKTVERWQNTLPLTLHNISGQAQAISLALSDKFTSTMPNNVTISWPEHDYIIPAKGSLTIEITLEISNPESLPFPANGAFVFNARLVVSSEQHSLTVPITLENAQEIVVHLDESAGGDLWLYTEDASFNRYFYLAAGSNNKFKVPNKPLTAVLDYENIDRAKFPGFALPENAIVRPIDIKRINPAFDTELRFILSDIDTLVGFESLLDENGLALGSDDLELSSYVQGIVYYGDTSIRNFFTLSKLNRVYLGFSSHSEITHGEFLTYGFLPNHAEKAGQLRIINLQTTVDGLSPGLHNLSPRLDQLRNIEVTLPEHGIEGDKYIAFYSVNRYGGSLSDIKKSQATSVMVSVISDIANDSLFSVGLAKATALSYDYLITSPQLKPVEPSGISAGSKWVNNRFSYMSDNIDLRSGGNYFSANIYSFNGSLRAVNNQGMQEWAVVHDINLNSYGPAQTAMEFAWLCEHEVITQYNMYPEDEVDIAIPELPCALPTLSISFNSWLQGTLHRSWFTAEQVETDNLYSDYINRVSISEQGINVDDQTVNRINAELIVDTSIAYTLRAEIQLNSGDYIELVKSEDTSNVMQARFALPMVSGQHIASVKLTYGDSEQYSQTLNGLFVFGADAGDADVDGDGISNNADSDDDNDGYPDTEDAFPLDNTEWLDTDGDGIGNNTDLDDDNDGYADTADAFPLDHTEWLDTDNDGVGNNADPDDDNDGMSDNWEIQYGLNPFDANDANSDKDNDGLTNLQEFTAGTYPDNADTDNDGMHDGWELENGLNPLDAFDASADKDDDLLTNLQEFTVGTHPNNADTDNDGMPDGWEVKYGLNPLDATDATTDKDNDDLTALQEYQTGTSPNVNNKPIVTPPQVNESSGGGGMSLFWLTGLLLVLFRRRLNQSN